MTSSPRRLVPRLSFSGRPAPRLETTGHSYEVLDLSPEGLRFRVATDELPTVTIGDVLRATLRFPADRSVEIQGRVLRVSGDEAAVRLERGQDRIAPPVPMGPARPRRTGLLW
jgi:hypothetical protein